MYTFTGVWRRGIEQKKLASLEFGEETWDWTKKMEVVLETPKNSKTPTL